MTLRSDGLRTKNRILSACVRLFLEKGYHHTTMQQIYEEANVSASSFQNIFHNKDGVLLELERYMYENQFAMAHNTAGVSLPPVYTYSVETAIQLTLTELNENVREIYLETYTHRESLEYVQQNTAKKLYQIFGPYQPELTEYDFYIIDCGTAGMMRGYMANPCTESFTPDKKVRTFLTLALRGFAVPEEEVQQILGFIAGLDIRSITQKVLDALFRQLAMHYEFSLDGILPRKEKQPAGQPVKE